MEFAIAHYGSKLRKDNRTPILLHGLRVVEILRRLGNVSDDVTLAAGLLHDILEDTEVKAKELEVVMGPEVCDIVISLTEDRSLPKDERKAKMMIDFASLPKKAKLIKLADRIDNLRGSWIKKSGIASRYARECRTMLEEVSCEPWDVIQKELARQLSDLEHVGNSNIK